MPFAKAEKIVFALKSLQQPEVTRATEGGGKMCKQMAADHIIFKPLVAMQFEAVTCSSSTAISVLSYFSSLCLERDLEQASSKLLCLSGRCVHA